MVDGCVALVVASLAAVLASVSAATKTVSCEFLRRQHRGNDRGQQDRTEQAQEGAALVLRRDSRSRRRDRGGHEDVRVPSI